MIVVRTPKDELFNYAECEELYNRLNDRIGDDSFREVIDRTFFYAFYIWQTLELIGCIYYYRKDDMLFVNAFAERGHHLINIECFKQSLTFFPEEDVYATTTQKTAIMCIRKCGFEKIGKDLYVYRRS